MKHIKWLLALCLLSIAATVFIYPMLPDRVATSWGFYGEVNAYGSKMQLLYLSVLPVILYFMLQYIPRIDPKFKNYEKHDNAYKIIRVSIVIMILCVNWTVLLSAIGYISDVRRWIFILIGLMLMVIGNYMGQVRPNYTLGIKIPWTLSDERVWKKVHRLGGVLYVALGLVIIASSFMSPLIGGLLFIIMFIIIHIIIVVNAYKLHKKLNE